MTHATRPVGIPQAFRRLPWPSGTWLDCRSKEDYLCADRKKTVLTFRWFDRSWVRCGSVPVSVAVAGRFSRKGDEMTETLKVPQPARRRRGVTLIEAVLYIAVALALIVGGLIFYQQASFASRVNRFASTASSLVSEARAIAAGSGNADTLLVPGAMENVLIAQASVPVSELDVTQPLGQRIRHPWGSFVTLGLQRTGGYTYLNFYMDSIPLEVCTRLAWFDGTGRGMFSTNINGINPRDDAGGSSGDILANDRSGASCRASDVNGNGKVSVSISHRMTD